VRRCADLSENAELSKCTKSLCAKPKQQSFMQQFEQMFSGM
jgi:hypothetical protein